MSDSNRSCFVDDLYFVFTRANLKSAFSHEPLVMGMIEKVLKPHLKSCKICVFQLLASTGSVYLIHLVHLTPSAFNNRISAIN